MPDFLVFAAWYPKLTGARLILDIHDIVPELFANKFKSVLKHVYVSGLRFVEKLSARFVDHVIVSNHLWVEKLVGRSVRPMTAQWSSTFPIPESSRSESALVRMAASLSSSPAPSSGIRASISASSLCRA